LRMAPRAKQLVGQLLCTAQCAALIAPYVLYPHYKG
jgi:hypothetical protein